MTRVLIAPIIANFTLIVLAGAMGQGTAQPVKDRPIAFYCPVAGMPEAKACCCPGGYCSLKPEPTHTIEYKGAKLQMCCGRCVKIFKAMPAKFAAVANHQLVATKQAEQVKCPSCVGRIDRAIALEVAGVKIAFCSDDCRKKVSDAQPKDRVNLVFGDAPFARDFRVLKAGKTDGQ